MSKIRIVENKGFRSKIDICCSAAMDESKYTWMRIECILVVEISSFKVGVFFNK